jgi:hypothetical protein
MAAPNADLVRALEDDPEDRRCGTEQRSDPIVRVIECLLCASGASHIAGHFSLEC